ncbi:hypothetical protein BN2476_470038 [Paraburkholderia piptadeniae]|uniref:Uncharacterized protein n=1 Tax=Paraburkholderia piptadeniae TaxID=1701573 RepID=A0A1N7SDY9_9BURK|nr:hypothetical protein BN2476_470038 [Paraburkholderia piptadeniae]
MAFAHNLFCKLFAHARSNGVNNTRIAAQFAYASRFICLISAILSMFIFGKEIPPFWLMRAKILRAALTTNSSDKVIIGPHSPASTRCRRSTIGTMNDKARRVFIRQDIITGNTAVKSR